MNSEGDETGTGRVVGYEFSVECPHCDHLTEAGEVSKENPVVCGGDFPADDNHGCGRELEVIVRATE